MRKMMFSGSSIFVLRIAASVATPNIASLAAAAGWNGHGRLIVDITAPYVNTLNFAAGAYPSGVYLRIGAASLVGGLINGGTAIKTRVPLVIENLGKVYGGGGLGADGQSVNVQYSSGWSATATGGSAGPGQGFANAGATTVSSPSTGSPGTYVVYTGSLYGGETAPWGQGGAGGAGGAWGQPGNGGGGATAGGTTSSVFYYPQPTVGPAGAYLDGAAYTTWVANGDRLGLSI